MHQVWIETGNIGPTSAMGQACRPNIWYKASSSFGSMAVSGSRLSIYKPLASSALDSELTMEPSSALVQALADWIAKPTIKTVKQEVSPSIRRNPILPSVHVRENIALE